MTSSASREYDLDETISGRRSGLRRTKPPETNRLLIVRSILTKDPELEGVLNIVYLPVTRKVQGTPLTYPDMYRISCKRSSRLAALNLLVGGSVHRAFTAEKAPVKVPKANFVCKACKLVRGLVSRALSLDLRKRDRKTLSQSPKWIYFPFSTRNPSLAATSA